MFILMFMFTIFAHGFLTVTATTQIL